MKTVGAMFDNAVNTRFDYDAIMHIFACNCHGFSMIYFSVCVRNNSQFKIINSFNTIFKLKVI